MRGQDRLHGEVVLVPPLSWQILGIFLLAVVVAAAVYLASASYGRATILEGEITSDKGLARAVAPQDGTLAELLVEEGQRVAAGTPLARIAAADAYAGTLTVAAAQSGTVTGIAARPGEAVGRSAYLLTIIPEGTRLEARLQVPSEAAGLIEPGQSVRVAVDAFPYQTYGTVEARIDSMSMAAVPVAGPEGEARQMFLARATLGASELGADGRSRPLRPGMNVRARVRTQSRSLAEWLFEPLFAVQRR
jgi:membrane fusion protein